MLQDFTAFLQNFYRFPEKSCIYLVIDIGWGFQPQRVENVAPCLSPQRGVHLNIENQIACVELCGCWPTLHWQYKHSDSNVVSHEMKGIYGNLESARVWWLLEFSFGRLVSVTVTWEGNNRTLCLQSYWKINWSWTQGSLQICQTLLHF